MINITLGLVLKDFEHLSYSFNLAESDSAWHHLSCLSKKRQRGLAEQLIDFPFVNENNTADSPLKTFHFFLIFLE